MSSAGARIWSPQAADKAANSRDEAAIDLIEAIAWNFDQIRFHRIKTAIKTLQHIIHSDEQGVLI